MASPKQFSAFSVQSISPSIQPLEVPQSQHQKPTEEHEIISLDLVNIGDILEIRSGELIPADGIIVDGFGALDKAPLTGESAPVEVEKGDELNAGLVLSRGPVLLKVTAVGEETRLSGLIEAVHSFKDQKAPIQNQIEKFTAIWVPIVLFGALVVWYLMFPTSNWKIILLLWVVACPCALLLAAAMPHAAALSRASRMGAVVRGGNILERMSKVNHVLLDKTGTLTSRKAHYWLDYRCQGATAQIFIGTCWRIRKTLLAPVCNRGSRISCERINRSLLIGSRNNRYRSRGQRFCQRQRGLIYSSRYDKKTQHYCPR